MDLKEAKENIQISLQKVTGESHLSVEDDMIFYEDFDLDSIDFLEFIFHVEKLTGIEIVVNDLLMSESIKSVKRMTVSQFGQFIIDQIKKKKSLS